MKSHCSHSGFARALALVSSVALLSACGSLPTDSGFRATLNQFYGASIGAVEDRFGPPDLVEKKPDGNTTYLWRRIHTVVTPFHKGEEVSEPMVTKVRVYGSSVRESKVSGWPYGRQLADANRDTEFCFFMFETGANQRVIGYEYWGNFCRLAAPAPPAAAK